MGGYGMTREEQIIEEAQKHGLNCMSRINYQDGFIEGAKWADKTMIDKACEWLEKKIDPKGVGRSQVVLFYDCIEDFKKSMEL